MRIGIGIGPGGGPGGDQLQAVLAQYKKAEDAGFAATWTPNVFSYDAIGLLALAGQMTSTIELGTFVVPTYPRHPMALAQQALTTAVATGNRFTLGIGLSHRVVIEDMYGLDLSKPIRHTREYLSVLMPLLEGKQVQFSGQEYQVSGQISVPGAGKPDVVVAALGPQMLKVAGAMADGTATWMGGPSYLEKVAVPTISAAANEAGRRAPRIVSGFPIALTSDVDAARQSAAKSFAMYGQLPSYRAVLDMEHEGMGPEEIAIVGGEEEIEAKLRRLRDIGVTDFNASPFRVQGDPEVIGRTTAFLAALAKSSL
jgi:F420-dependent oxidoreductase-like protein